MIELLTTPKTAILFAIISTVVLDAILTLFITLEGLPFISSIAFCRIKDIFEFNFNWHLLFPHKENLYD